MREVISIFIGQAGVQLGSAVWELFNLEHGIEPDGMMTPYVMECNGIDFIGTFYQETRKGKFVPRSIFVDLEPNVIDEIRNNQYAHLFHPDSLLTGKEDAANNYARGHYTVGREMIQAVTNSIRHELDMCDAMAGFFLFHSMGGGTGSGLTTLIAESLAAEYDKKHKLEFVIYPCPRLTTAVVEPYNAVLVANGTMDICDCGFLVDNEALYRICSDQLDLESPTYVTLNRIVSQVVSALTASIRFTGSLDVDLSVFETNLVPYPRIHYPLIAYAPFASLQRARYQKVNVETVTRQCFDRTNQLLRVDPTHGKYMACCLLYRGLLPNHQVTSAIQSLRASRLRFVNWSPTGFKVGLNYQPPTAVPGSGLCATQLAVCAVMNTTAIVEAWSRLNYKFDLMFSKRAYAHWYVGEGMDEQEFIEARDNLAALEKDYEECERDNPTADGSDLGNEAPATTSEAPTDRRPTSTSAAEFTRQTSRQLR